jgi:hypothetical protein
MKKIILLLIIITVTILNISGQKGNKVLLIIDIQDFYFPGGKSALVEPEKAVANAALILDNFRKDLKFREKSVKAADVQYSALSTLKNYALIQSTNEFLKKK